MALLGTRKSTPRVRGIARREKLLAAARALLEERDLDEISLGDVAARADVPTGSAYHFYEDIKALYTALLAEIERELLDALRAPIRKPVDSWQSVVKHLIDRGVAFYAASPASARLIIGPKIPPELKLQDRQNDVAIGKIFEDHISHYFVLPALPQRSTIFFRAVEIADLMFCLSMNEHDRVTRDMTAEAVRGAVSYLESYLGKSLPRARARA